jgi:hypothetical protein
LSAVTQRNSDFYHHVAFMCSPGTFNTDYFSNINRLDLVVIECFFLVRHEFLNVIRISARVQVVKSVYVCLCVLVGIWFTIW